MHATDFLRGPETADIPPIVVMHGTEAGLKEAVREKIRRNLLGDPDDATGITRLSAADVDWARVRDELATVSMFGDRRVMVLEDADEFVSDHRDNLERYFDKPARRSVLILEVKSWRSNTRLAKKLAAAGLELDCSELKGPELEKWLVAVARDRYQKQLTRDAVSLMVELAGTGVSLLEQELAKLAAYAGERARITVDDVRTLVGGWRAETTWKMTDAIRDGRPEAALEALNKLLYAGEAPQRILGGVTYAFRKYARAAELAMQGTPLRSALQQSGVFPRDVAAGENYLRRIGRARAERIRVRLLEADRGMKGGARISDRLQLEQLILSLCQG